jgi:hypothetical protein
MKKLSDRRRTNEEENRNKVLNFDQSILQVQNIAKDSTVGSLDFIKTNLNLGYKYIIAELGRSVTNKTKITPTVALQQFYQCPKDFIFPRTVTITIGSIKYPVDCEESQDNWDLLNSFPQVSNIPRKYFIRRSFGVNTIEIGLWPIPYASGNNITVVYEAADKDLTQSAYTTGTVTATNGSTIIDGSGVTFTPNMVSRFFQVTDSNGDGTYYKIIAYNSPSEIVIENGYEGLTYAGLDYQIVEIFNLPEEMQTLPVYYTLMNYYAIKGDDTKEIKNKNLFDEGLLKAKQRYANKGRSGIIRKNYFHLGTYPSHFPIYFS